MQTDYSDEDKDREAVFAKGGTVHQSSQGMDSTREGTLAFFLRIIVRTALTRDEALAWFKRVLDGTADEREAYRKLFGAGTVAEYLWNDPSFTLGVEYGIHMALVMAFDIKPEEV